VQDRSPQRFRHAYSWSRMGPRTFRTSKCPRAGLMVRRMNPSLICPVNTSRCAIAAYSSSRLAMVASDLVASDSGPYHSVHEPGASGDKTPSELGEVFTFGAGLGKRGLAGGLPTG
jgi:hypothetical protein